MRRLISAATNEELRIAHSRWSSVLELFRLLSSNAHGATISKELAQIGRQTAVQFGSLSIFGLLLAGRKGNGQWVDFHLERARNHILATPVVIP